MEHEIRFYLGKIKDEAETIDGETGQPAFTPQHLVTAVKLPTGAIEITVNNKNIIDKIDYILDAYDENMKLKANPDVEMQNIMIV